LKKCSPAGLSDLAQFLREAHSWAIFGRNFRDRPLSLALTSFSQKSSQKSVSHFLISRERNFKVRSPDKVVRSIGRFQWFLSLMLLVWIRSLFVVVFLLLIHLFCFCFLCPPQRPNIAIQILSFNFLTASSTFNDFDN
jgi:hypothetical protein